MILYTALGVDAANSPITGIHTLIIFTSQSDSTVSMDFTLSSATREWVTEETTFTFTKASVARRS